MGPLHSALWCTLNKMKLKRKRDPKTAHQSDHHSENRGIDPRRASTCFADCTKGYDGFVLPSDIITPAINYKITVTIDH